MSSSKPRHIDRMASLSSPRPVEMQVLCLGLSRTATWSLSVALEKLGYKAYHFREIFSAEAKKDGHIWAWDEALKAKVDGEGQPFAKEEFDKILGRYSAVTDAPCACFPDELIAAYPNAKVVLGVRDPDKWVASMKTSYYEILRWPTWRMLCSVNKFLGAEYSIQKRILRLWTNNDIYNMDKLREGYLKHNEHIRSIVPKDNLLEFRPEQGWEPLCNFLGKDVPKDEPYPRLNEGDGAANVHRYIFWLVLGKYAMKGALVPVLVGGLAWGLSWGDRSGYLRLPWKA